MYIICTECVLRYAEVEIGQGNFTFPCMSTNCPASYSVHALYNVLDSKTFEKVMVKKQEAEILAANITNLESCPFCSYAIEFYEKATKDTKLSETVLRCQNDHCSKVSCR